jgi:hypothetical protein
LKLKRFIHQPWEKCMPVIFHILIWSLRLWWPFSQLTHKIREICTNSAYSLSPNISMQTFWWCAHQNDIHKWLKKSKYFVLVSILLSPDFKFSNYIQTVWQKYLHFSILNTEHIVDIKSIHHLVAAEVCWKIISVYIKAVKETIFLIMMMIMTLPCGRASILN